ncbi:hypothetical protein KSS87_018828 [Heliosperma pusillum]|nr:hypothetical protein KSS87_018828 [Heliosperma pusillum]
MADELLDGEFWLPSQFLTDDDILMDFKSDTSASGFGFGSSSDLASLTSDDDDHLLHYSSKPQPGLSGSPQSTLCGWELTHPDSGSGSGSPQKEEPEKRESNETKNDVVEDKNATLDLLNKAAGEVAKMKLRTERSTVQYSPPQQQLQNTKKKDTKTATNGINNNRPLGLPPSAWPPLPGQTQTQAQTQPQAQPQQPQQKPQVQPYIGLYVGPQSASVGTGVFLPRQTPTNPEPKKKSDSNVMKTKNNKASQRRSSVPAKTNIDEIQLPLEWVY